MATTKVQDLEGPAQTRFFTKQWLPQGPPRAALLFVHG